MGVTEIRDDSHWSDIHKNSKGKLVVVDFFATWCGPCKAVAPIYEQLSNKYGSEVIFVKVDVDKCREIAQNAKVEAMPSFGFYVEGQLLLLQKGGDPAELERNIKSLNETHSKYAFKSGKGHVLGANTGTTSTTSSSSNVNSATRTAPTGRKNPWADPNFFPKGSSLKSDESKTSSSSTTPNPSARTNIPAASLEKLTNPKPQSTTSIPANNTNNTATTTATSTSSSNSATPSADGMVPASTASTDTRIKVNSSILTQLTDMGFPLIRAEKALILTGNKSLEIAMNWLLEHSEDADIDQPLIVEGTATKPTTATTTPAAATKKGAEINLDDLDEDALAVYEAMKKDQAKPTTATNNTSSTASNADSSSSSNSGKKSVSEMSHEEKMAWLQNKREEKKREREQTAIEKEKTNYKATKQLTTAVNDLKERREEEAAKLAYARKQKEEAERVRAKREIQQKIAADKERRKIEQQRAIEAAKAAKANAAAPKK